MATGDNPSSSPLLPLKGLLPRQAVDTVLPLYGNTIVISKYEFFPGGEEATMTLKNLYLELHLLVGTFPDGRICVVNHEGVLIVLQGGETIQRLSIPIEFNGQMCCFGELVGIASIERFVYLVNLRTLKEEIVDTGPGAIASMKFVDNSHGLNYLLITKVYGCLEPAEVIIFNIQSKNFKVIELPKGFSFPTRLLYLSDFTKGPAFVSLNVDDDFDKENGKGGEEEKEEGEGEEEEGQKTRQQKLFPRQLLPVSRASDQIRLVESISNILKVDERVYFSISWNTGEIQHCKVEGKDGDINILSTVNVKSFFSSMCLLENRLLICNSPVKGLQVFDKIHSNEVSLVGKFWDRVVALDMVCGHFIKGRKEEEEEGEETLVACGFGDLSTLAAFKDNVPVNVEAKSDQLFRGCTGLWMLRRYNSDKHHSIIAISFLSSTILLKLGDGGLFEDTSEFYGVDAFRRTLSIENACSSSFFIQVCPDRIIICKSNCGETTGDVLSDWRPDPNQSPLQFFSSATIVNDHVFALDVKLSQVSIFYCRTTRGSIAVIPILTINVSNNSSALTVIQREGESFDSYGGTGGGGGQPSSPKEIKSNFLLAVAATNQIRLWSITIEGGGSLSKSEEFMSHLTLKDDDDSLIINEMQLVKVPSSPVDPRLIVGSRDGKIVIFIIRMTVGQVVDENVQPSCYYHQLSTLKVGNRPVQLLRVRLSDVSGRIVALSGTANLLLENRDDQTFSALEIFPRADHLVRWSTLVDSKGGGEGEKKYTFIAIEHESMVVFTSILKRKVRLEPICKITCLRKLLVKRQNVTSGGGVGGGGTNLLVAISSPSRIEQEALNPPGSWVTKAPSVEVYNISDEELLYSTTLTSGDIITCATLIEDKDLIVIGMQVQNVGQVRVLRIPSMIDRVSRRRSSVPSSQSRSVPPQLIFTCDIGFPHKVNSIVDMGGVGVGVGGGESRKSGIGGGGRNLLVAAGPELHLINLNDSEDSISFVHTETWRSEITLLAVAPGGKSRFVACTKRGGIGLYEMKMEGGVRLKLAKRWNSVTSGLIDRIVWCGEDRLAAADRRGFILLIEFGSGNVNCKIIAFFGIPCSIAFRSSTNTLLVTTISGSIWEYSTASPHHR